MLKIVYKFIKKAFISNILCIFASTYVTCAYACANLFKHLHSCHAQGNKQPTITNIFTIWTRNKEK